MLVCRAGARFGALLEHLRELQGAQRDVDHDGACTSVLSLRHQLAKARLRRVREVAFQLEQVHSACSGRAEPHSIAICRIKLAALREGVRRLAPLESAASRSEPTSRITTHVCTSVVGFSSKAWLIPLLAGSS